MFIVMILRLKKLLYFKSLGIKLQPLFVGGLRYPVWLYACGFEPLTDAVDTILRRSEDIVNLFRSVMLAVS